MSEQISNSEIEILTPGKILKKARVARNLTESDVAQQLLLGKQTIVALENDDYSKIVASVYAKGYLKAYAEFLGLSHDSILESFNKMNVYAETRVFSDVPTKPQIDFQGAFMKNMRVHWVLYGVFALIVVVLIFVIASHSASSTSSDEVATNDSAVTLDAPTKDVPINQKDENVLKVKPSASVVETTSSLSSQTAALSDDGEKSQRSINTKNNIKKTDKKMPNSEDAGGTSD